MDPFKDLVRRGKLQQSGDLFAYLSKLIDSSILRSMNGHTASFTVTLSLSEYLTIVGSSTKLSQFEVTEVLNELGIGTKFQQEHINHIDLAKNETFLKITVPFFDYSSALRLTELSFMDIYLIQRYHELKRLYNL